MIWPCVIITLPFHFSTRGSPTKIYQYLDTVIFQLSLYISSTDHPTPSLQLRYLCSTIVCQAWLHIRVWASLQRTLHLLCKSLISLQRTWRCLKWTWSLEKTKSSPPPLGMNAETIWLKAPLAILASCYAALLVIVVNKLSLVKPSVPLVRSPPMEPSHINVWMFEGIIDLFACLLLFYWNGFLIEPKLSLAVSFLLYRCGPPLTNIMIALAASARGELGKSSSSSSSSSS